jgi:aminoglycoside phosphotransferase (APT) family kinase protein
VSEDFLDPIPPDRRETARIALAAAFGAASMTALRPVGGGASGALIYRLDVGGRSYLLRMETRRGAFRNPHQYTSMQTAADAGVAPPLLYADADAGVAIMDFVESRPLHDYPGGPAALARDLGRLVARLQATPVFPAFVDYMESLDRMLVYVRRSTVFAPGLLDPHCEGFERIRQAYPWDAAAFVSSHNDPNPRNVIFDGDRLWLVDWETSYRNDPLTDVAILVDNLAATPEQQDLLLQAWLGRPPDRALRARLVLMRQLTRLYYAALGFSFFASIPRNTPPDADLTAPTPDEFRSAIATGRLQPTGPETLYVLGKMCLAGFKAGVGTTEFAESVDILQGG